VLGAIAPVDPNAPLINFEVNLPTQWNGKPSRRRRRQQRHVDHRARSLARARRDTPVPVARGFATWGTDSGHRTPSFPNRRPSR
jgi:feruloyl esterase